ncbi:DNA topoisomerase I [Halorhodospira abdelmalekii]|uniref:DNA topoisomerase I n=1 Tax=Halorhodospira abdelmalekii TaxID=421629 RepID=UPI0019077F81|nr:DNA topoisomerase I [Halorhodospira abdelmalekii]MBK1734391.1 DNA topoisomerase I [Halorhodospira abdelmalekii]
MGKSLVIVESPAKARTINKYLGSSFEVMASYGHVRDLVPKEGAVDPEHGFAMKYAPIDKNQRHVEAIAKAIRGAEALYLATDPDREGEAISWHLVELLRDRGLLEDKPVYRVVFHEITQGAIREAMAHPRVISAELVNAQQARRALDYLVGFNLSPLLWRKITSGLSAGRVQSPALRMICEREEEIERFEPQEYWTIEGDAAKAQQSFSAKLALLAGEKVKQFTITDEQRAREVETQLRAAAFAQAQQDLSPPFAEVTADAPNDGSHVIGQLRVVNVERKQRRRNPAAPFITSTLQQEASRKLGFTASRTMRIAQQLYEGIDVGEGAAVGLITYMRTDSVSLSQEAVAEMREVIAERYGSDKLPSKPQTYKTRSKNAQEAHEAIRPTSAARHPEKLRGQLSSDQYRLYELVWKRAVACQMKHATINTVAVDLAADVEAQHLLRATGSTVADPGFMVVYREGTDDTPPGKEKDEAGEKFLPELSEGERVPLYAIRPEQHFTEPPPRYTEASLVRTLEEHGIGRPSTYASIISTLQQRNYVEMDGKRFIPTDIGRTVNKFLTEHFDRYVDYDFTARLEDDLDAISRGEREWVPVLEAFWQPFSERVEEKKGVSRQEAVQARELGTDPKSGKPVTVRIGRYGPFAQLGSKEDEEKPRFAGLRPGQSIDTITLDEALVLFQLPRDMGETEEGEEMQVNIGRFGPYVRFGGKFASIPKGEDPYTITRERALELVREKKVADANRTIHDFGDGIRVLRGRYGPYVTNGEKNAKIPKEREPESLTHTECLELIANAPERKGRRGGSTAKGAKSSTAGKASKTGATKASTTKKSTKSTSKSTTKSTKKSAAAQEGSSEGGTGAAATPAKRTTTAAKGSASKGSASKSTSSATSTPKSGSKRSSAKTPVTSSS